MKVYRLHVIVLIILMSVYQGKLVYANYGTMEDYMLLSKAVNLSNTIAIVKYGGAGRQAKVTQFTLFYITVYRPVLCIFRISLHSSIFNHIKSLTCSLDQGYLISTS